MIPFLQKKVKRCKICNAKTTNKEVAGTFADNPNYVVKYKTLQFECCVICSYCFSEKNFKDYLLSESKLAKPGSVPRVGDGERPGREFFMANESIPILQKKVSVAIFGAGHNRDHVLIRKLREVHKCNIIDLSNFQNSEYFLPIETNETFDVVVACEVIEHFTDPLREFANLFSLLKHDGILIASTSIRTEENFSHRMYPFFEGHTSYYTAKSLILLAQQFGSYIEFATPTIGLPRSKEYSPNKKYIYFTRNKKSYFKIKEFLAIRGSPWAEDMQEYFLQQFNPQN